MTQRVYCILMCIHIIPMHFQHLTSRLHALLLQRGKQFAETSTRARQTIAELGAGFVRHDAVVMVHGFSRVALALLQQVADHVSLHHTPLATLILQHLCTISQYCKIIIDKSRIGKGSEAVGDLCCICCAP